MSRSHSTAASGCATLLFLSITQQVVDGLVRWWWRWWWLGGGAISKNETQGLIAHFHY